MATVTIDRNSARAQCNLACTLRGLTPSDAEFERIVNGYMLAEAQDRSGEGQIIESITITGAPDGNQS